MENLVFKNVWIEQARKFRFTWLSLTLQVHLFINFASWVFFRVMESAHISSGDSKVQLCAEWLTNQNRVCHSEHPIQTWPVLVSCLPFTHTSCLVNKSWRAGLISPSFTHLEGIHVVLTGHQKEAGSSLETLVPSSGICLRLSWLTTLETPAKWPNLIYTIFHYLK